MTKFKQEVKYGESESTYFATTADGEVLYGDGADYTMGTEESYTLYAVWQANLNTLYFVGNGNTGGEMASMTIYTDETKGLTANGFEKTYYHFMGWATTPDGEVVYADGENYTMGANAEYTLYAVWEADVYTIAYELDNGVNSNNNPKEYTVESEQILLEEPTKTGYKFLGWYKNEIPIIKIEQGSNGDITLTAKWEIIVYTITYHFGDGTNSPENPTTFTVLSYPQSFVWATPVEGMYSHGWYFDEAFTQKCTQITQVGNVNLYAKYCDYNYGLQFTVKSNQATVSDYTGTDIDVVIPSLYNGYPVTWIGYEAFYNCNSLTSIEIPDSVTSIYSYAFSYCSRLTSIVIPDSVTEIGLYTFSGCSSLTSVTIGNSVTTIGSSAFYNCSSLTSIVIPDSVTEIGWSAFEGCSSLTSVTFGENSQFAVINYEMFYGCSSLTSIVIPDSVTSIGYEAFYYCSSLTSIVIPDSVATIGYEAFYYCSSLTSVTIGNGVTSIGESAFVNCSALTKVNYMGTIDDWVMTDFVDYYANPLYYAEKLYINDGEVSEVILTNATKIKAYAFYNCSSLTSIDIPDGVTEIGSYAFFGCSKLTSIEIPNSVTEIGRYAFSYCSSLTSIVIPDSVTSIGNYAFHGCSGLTSITLPFVGASKTATGYQSVFGYIFGYKTSLYSTIDGEPYQYVDHSITYYKYYYYFIPSSLRSVTITGGDIGSSAFYNCSNLTSVTIGDGVTSIGSSAFSGCSSLTKVNYMGTIDGWAMIDFESGSSNPLSYAEKLYINDVEIMEVVLTETTEIKPYAFYYCSGLTSIVIPDSVTTIGSSAFSGCSSLTSIVIPDSVTSIGSYAFYNCTALTEIKFNATAMSDLSSSNYVFYNAGQSGTGITVTIGANVTKIPAYLFYPYFSSSYAPNITSVVFEENSVCTSIGSSAFYDCSSLTSIVIPDSVTAIGSYAFANCSSLTSIEIPDSVTTIVSGAFADCSSLTSIEIPDSVTSIGEDAFRYCSSLTSIVIPDSVTSIGEDAFFGCNSLTNVYYGGTSEQWSAISIGSYNTRLTNATRYYYSADEPTLNAEGTAYDGNYWHYGDNGEIVVWAKETVATE